MRNNILSDWEINGRIIYKNVIYDAPYILESVDKMFSFISKRKHLKEDTIIAIALSRGIDYIIADLMAIKYGITFLNLDITIPAERNEYFIFDSKADFIITTKEFCCLFGQNDNVCIDGYRDEMEEINSYCYKKSEVAYILYTSGTTGRPKGVEVYRKGLENFCKGMSYAIDFKQAKTMACFTNQSFDIYFLEAVYPLLHGMDVVLCDQEEISNPKAMIDLILKNGVDVLQLTPSRIRLLKIFDEKMLFLEKIKVLMIGGEKFPEELVPEFNERADMDVYNMYGPTETTIWSTVSHIAKYEKVDVGLPIINTNIYVLNEIHEKIGVGEIGEIAIGGFGVARGYKNNDELTDDKFITLNDVERVYLTGDIGVINEKGRIQVFGRKDDQVKINGYRVELSEVECTLFGLGVARNVVTCYDCEKNVLVTFYVSDRDVKDEEWISYLEQYLPKYMIPSKYIKLESIPYTVSGKCDRNALLNQYQILQEEKENYNLYDAISNEVLNILSEVGEVERKIKPEMFFSELYLDSLRFVKIVVEIEAQYDIEFDSEYMIVEYFTYVKDFIDYIKEKIGTTRCN